MDDMLVMDEDSIINDGETLKIPPGTVVSLGKDVRLTVYGALEVRGEVNDPVVFRRSDPNYPWEGILVEKGGFAHIVNADISGGTRTIICNNSSPILENLSIRDATNGLIVAGDSKPFVRNVKLDNVVNGIGLRSNENSGADFDYSFTEWQVNMSGSEGSIDYPAQHLSSDSFISLQSNFKNLKGNNATKVVLENSFHLSAFEHLSRDGLRLVLSYDRTMEDLRGIKVRLNGIIQNTSCSVIDAGLCENGTFFQALELSGFYDNYSDMLSNKRNSLISPTSQVPNIIPNEYHIALGEGLMEGLNVIRVELDENLFSDKPPSVFMESALPTGGVYDNISMTNGGDWGLFISGSEPLFSRVNVEGVSRHMVVKGCSRPVLLECNFVGGNATDGIISLDEGAFIRIRDSTFSDFTSSPIELSQGTAALVFCRFENITTNEMGALKLDVNPFIIPSVASLLEIRPIVINGIEMKNISGWGLMVLGGRISIFDSTFADSANGLYIGEGTAADIRGNTFRDLVSTGILLYRAMDNRVNINSNLFIAVEKYGIIVKQTSASLSDNIVEGSIDHAVSSVKLTDTYLLERNWAVYIENSICSLESNFISNNSFSILVGIDSIAWLENNRISGIDGIGIGVLSKKAVHISETSVTVLDGYDIVYFEDSKVSFDQVTYNTTAYIEEGNNELDEGYFSVIIPVIILFVLLLVALVRIKIK